MDRRKTEMKSKKTLIESARRPVENHADVKQAFLDVKVVDQTLGVLGLQVTFVAKLPHLVTNECGVLWRSGRALRASKRGGGLSPKVRLTVSGVSAIDAGPMPKEESGTTIPLPPGATPREPDTVGRRFKVRPLFGR